MATELNGEDHSHLVQDEPFNNHHFFTNIGNININDKYFSTRDLYNSIKENIDDLYAFVLPKNYQYKLSASGIKSNNLFFSGRADDEISGDDGIDFLYGNDGDDRLHGGNDADFLNGGDGYDRLHGGNGADFLNGGDGYDRLHGGKENDELNGGLGRDVFIFNMGDGHDVIKDFENESDFIQLNEFQNYGEFENIRELLSQDDENVILTFDETQSITIENIQLSQLTADDFSFL